MTETKKNSQVDAFLSEAAPWQEEMAALRKLLLDAPLTEELKWGKPCYSVEQGNIVIIQGFKEYCALLFFKGALLKDPRGILIQQTENVQSGRQIRFTGISEIKKLATAIKAYVQEAISVERAGLKVEFKKTSEFKVPEELQNKFKAKPALETAFKALTPGRQRAYLLYFAAAKQSKTREARIEKCAPQILKGKGLND